MFNKKNLTEFFFLMVLAILFVGFAYVISPYLGVIFFSLILVEIFSPWYEFLVRKLKSQKLASLIAGLSIILTVVIPIIVISIIVVFQANNLVGKVEGFWQEHDLIGEYSVGLEKVNELISKVSSNPENQITNEEVQQFAIKFSESFLNTIVNGLKGSVSKTLSLVTQASLLLISIFSLFSLRPRLYKAIVDLSPLDDNVDKLFIKNFVETSNAIIKGTFVVAFGLGIIGGFAFWILGLEAPVFWGMMIALFSIIPIGSGIVWIPASIYLLISGEVIKALVLFGIGLAMTNGIDSLLRTQLANAKSSINPLLLAFSILGGLKVFGVMGLLYGPLIVVLFITVLKVYQAKYV